MKHSAGEQIKTLMNRKNVTMSKLANRLGTSRQNLSNKFHRDNFPEKEIARICEALGGEYEIIIDDKAGNK